MRRAVGMWGSFVLLVCLLWPAVASACPQCAQREGYGVAGLLVLGTMILLPFMMAGLLLPALRRLNLERHEIVSVPEERYEEV